MNDLILEARRARDKAIPWKSGVYVGCAIKTSSGYIVHGWNIEGLWQTSIHAEVCAITQLAPLGERGMEIAISCPNSTFFTPCGACIDWLWQFCDHEAVIEIETKNEIFRFTLKELMPHYPRQ